jgi:hypothetical protein
LYEEGKWTVIFDGDQGIVWRNYVLCGHVIVPIGVHVPSMIAFARSICRSQEVYPQLDEISPESWL